MACRSTVESRFDFRVEQQVDSVLVRFMNKLQQERLIIQLSAEPFVKRRRQTISKAYPHTHRADLPNQQTRRGHLPLMNLPIWQAKAQGGL